MYQIFYQKGQFQKLYDKLIQTDFKQFENALDVLNQEML